LPIIIVLFLGSLLLPSAFAQFQSGGVDKDGSWYAGEGLKQGDFFSYSMCHVDYKECAEFELDMWIKGDKQVGSETKWLADVVVYDGSKKFVGEMELGKIAPEPTGGSSELGVYRGAFKSSIAWLSAFATSDDSSGGKGPKEFRATSWGKIGNIGGEQVVPKVIEKITVPAGTWETVQIGWKTGGVSSKVWIVDGFPFPIKAKTYTHVSEGIPPTEYEFTLLKYQEHAQNPFKDILSSPVDAINANCDNKIVKSTSIKKPTHNFDYQVHVFYGPEDPIQGCDVEMLINFINKYDDTEFLNQVKFDILTVDDNLVPLRSLAQEEGRPFLYSPSGQHTVSFVVKENPGIAHYVVWIYGLAPEPIVPAGPADYMEMDIIIHGSGEITQKIPAWVKNNAGWWSNGSIGDSDFVQGIQFLIKEGIMKVPQSSSSSSSKGSEPEAWYN